jgi:hypothetical protein
MMASHGLTAESAEAVRRIPVYVDATPNYHNLRANVYFVRADIQFRDRLLHPEGPFGTPSDSPGGTGLQAEHILLHGFNLSDKNLVAVESIVQPLLEFGDADGPNMQSGTGWRTITIGRHRAYQPWVPAHNQAVGPEGANPGVEGLIFDPGINFTLLIDTVHHVTGLRVQNEWTPEQIVARGADIYYWNNNVEGAWYTADATIGTVNYGFLATPPANTWRARTAGMQFQVRYSSDNQWRSTTIERLSNMPNPYIWRNLNPWVTSGVLEQPDYQVPPVVNMLPGRNNARAFRIGVIDQVLGMNPELTFVYRSHVVRVPWVVWTFLGADVRRTTEPVRVDLAPTYLGTPGGWHNDVWIDAIPPVERPDYMSASEFAKAHLEVTATWVMRATEALPNKTEQLEYSERLSRLWPTPNAAGDIAGGPGDAYDLVNNLFHNSAALNSRLHERGIKYFTMNYGQVNDGRYDTPGFGLAGGASHPGTAPEPLSVWVSAPSWACRHRLNNELRNPLWAPMFAGLPAAGGPAGSCTVACLDVEPHMDPHGNIGHIESFEGGLANFLTFYGVD